MTLLACEPPDLKDLTFPLAPGVMEEINIVLGQIEYTKVINPSFEKVQDEFVKHSSKL